MKHIFLSFVLFAGLGSPCIAGTKKSKDPALKEKTETWMQNMPVRFLENKGQMTDMNGKPVPFVLFKTEAPGLDMYVTEKGITYVFIKAEEEAHPNPDSFFSERTADEGKTEWNRIDMMLQGANIRKENIVKEGISADFSQYFLAHCPDGIRDVRRYEKITIKEIYPGIDWILYNSDKKGFKYDFAVHPGADPEAIKLVYSSLEPLQLNENGSMKIPAALGTLTEQTPYSYIRETKEEVSTKFKISKQQRINDQYYQTTISFSLNSTSQNLRTNIQYSTLIIDPKLVWATFYGGNSPDGPTSIDCDLSGNIFVTGYTRSTNFPVLDAGGGVYYQGTLTSGMGKVFILKFSNSGVLMWATFYGGNTYENGYSICTDLSGNVFVTGITTSSDFPTQDPGGGAYFDATKGGTAMSEDAFILKFSNAGVRIWATYYGGTGLDWGNSICTDSSGNIFVTGFTASSDFSCVDPGGGAYFQPINAGVNDAFIIKFSNAGVRQWATYYGGSGDDRGYAICTDPSGQILITGATQSTNLPVLSPEFSALNAGGYDAFILKLDNNGVRKWATYYGGSGNDWAQSVSADRSGNVFITGYTNSINLPVRNPGGNTYFQGTNAGQNDAFILKLTNTDSCPWATYYGGSGGEGGAPISNYMFTTWDNIGLDNFGNVYISMNTSSSNMPVQAPCDSTYYDGIYNGAKDIFISKFSNAGEQLWATYFGGDGYDLREALTVDRSGNLFIAGEWCDAGSTLTNASYPLTDPGGGAYYVGTHNGSDDGFIAKFVSKATLAGATTICPGQSATLFASSGSAYSWNTGSTNDTISVSPTSTTTYSVIVTNGSCLSDTLSTTITVVSCTGIGTIFNDETITVFPNPTAGEFTVDGLQFAIESELKIVNILGETVLQKTVSNKQEIINLKDAPSGSYFLHIRTQKGLVVRKIVRE